MTHETNTCESLPAKSERILRVEMSPMQKKYSEWIMAKNFKELNKGTKGKQTTLLNIVMEVQLLDDRDPDVSLVEESV